MGSFSGKAVRGIKWTTVSVVSNSVIRLLQVSILTRYLTRADFGTIAIATLFIGFTELFLDMGLSAAIIHKQEIPKHDYSSLFWLNIFTGLFLLLVLLLCAPLISGYYDDSSLTPIIQLLSLNLLFSSIGRQHRTQRQKQLDFRFIALTDIATAILTFVVAVTLALKGYGVYSLVWSTLFHVLSSSLIFLVYGLKKDKNITVHFRVSETVPYLRIGVFQIGSRFLDYLAKEMDIFIISSTLGRDVLGVYSLCKKLGAMLYGIVSPVILNVLTPLFAEIQSSQKEVQGKFTRLIEIVSTVNYPLFFLLALLAPGLIRILYGPGYADQYMILSLLAVSYGILSVSGVLTASQVALGRTDLGFYWTIFRIFSMAVYIYVGSFWSVTGIAAGILAGTAINLLPFWYMQVRKILNIPLRVFLGDQLLPFLTAGSLYAGLMFFVTPDVSVWGMALTAIIFLGLYGAAIILINPGNQALVLATGFVRRTKI